MLNLACGSGVSSLINRSQSIFSISSIVSLNLPDITHILFVWLEFKALYILWSGLAIMIWIKLIAFTILLIECKLIVDFINQ